MSTLGKVTRRGFLLGSVALAGGVAFGYYKYKEPYDNPLKANPAEGEAALTPYVLINQDGVTIVAPRAEMGQGVMTTLAAMVAEELECDVADCNIIHGPGGKAYYNAALLEEAVPFPATDVSGMATSAREFMHVPGKFLAMQMTGGSTSTPDAYVKMRQAGAAAREALKQVAAKELGVSVGDIRPEKGYMVAPNGKKLSYKDLAPKAAGIELPEEPKLKPQSSWKQLGKSLPRVDMPGKVTGTAQYAIDTRLDGMLFATIRVNPRQGGVMNGYDASAAKNMRGVKRILEVDNGVAVVATNTWYAFKAMNEISFDWGAAPYPAENAEHFAAIAAAFDGDYDSRQKDEGDVEANLTGPNIIEAEYRAPYLAHATMEPMTAAALVKDGKLEIWAGNQFPTQVVSDAIDITGFVEENITLNTTMLGGGFGRRLELDFVHQAIKIAMQMEGTPVQLTWSREEDMTHDVYRTAAIGRFQGKVENGKIKTADLKLAATSVTASQMGRYGIPAAGPDVAIVQAAWDQPYGIENYRVTGYRAPEMPRVGFWRSVGSSQNGFFHESMIDELAHAAGVDPLELRIQQMPHPASRKVLETVGEMSNWGSALPAGHARGVAYVMSFGVPTAEVIEIANTDDGIKILKAWAVVDVGTALDPRNIEAQVQSGLNYGLSAAIKGEITFSDGKAEQENFDTFDSIRMYEAPSIDVKILENGENIKGIGEPGTPPAAPALANAIFAATGKRIRELPLANHVDFV